jgi:hypothetical protein
LFGSGLVVGVCRFYMLYLYYLKCLPMLLSVPASCHCDRCFCHSPYAVPTAYLRSDASNGCCTYLCVPAPARYIVPYASRMRCMLPTYRSMFCTITFGAYRTFEACVRSIRAVRNHFFLLMADRDRDGLWCARETERCCGPRPTLPMGDVVLLMYRIPCKVETTG